MVITKCLAIIPKENGKGPEHSERVRSMLKDNIPSITSGDYELCRLHPQKSVTVFQMWPSENFETAFLVCA